MDDMTIEESEVICSICERTDKSVYGWYAILQDDKWIFECSEYHNKKLKDNNGNCNNN